MDFIRYTDYCSVKNANFRSNFIFTKERMVLWVAVGNNCLFRIYLPLSAQWTPIFTFWQIWSWLDFAIITLDFADDDFAFWLWFIGTVHFTGTGNYKNLGRFTTRFWNTRSPVNRPGSFHNITRFTCTFVRNTWSKIIFGCARRIRTFLVCFAWIITIKRVQKCRKFIRHPND